MLKHKINDNFIPVCNEVTDRDLCIGCGVCAYVCPEQNIYIDWNDRGLLVAKPRRKQCIKRCGLCLRVCPFTDGNPNEDEIGNDLYAKQKSINQSPDLGYFISCWVGYSSKGKQRELGASGGIASWFLSKLLEDGIVKYVVCVTPCKGPRPLFRYVVCNSADEVLLASKSAYYPIELSDVLESIRTLHGPFAVTALPCFAKALRLLSIRDALIRQNLACIVGLVCGHGVSAFFSEYAGAIACEDMGKPDAVVFRIKNPQYNALNYGTLCSWSYTSSSKMVYRAEGLSEAWSGHWFTPNPCFFCDDVFSETADIVFMDAWLPQYINDYRGTNLIITRSVDCENIIQDGVLSQELCLEKCSCAEVISSQYEAVNLKKKGLSQRVWYGRKHGLQMPVKRVIPCHDNDMYNIRLLNNQILVAKLGASIWEARSSLEQFNKRMRKASQIKYSSFSLGRISMLPPSILRKTKSLLLKWRQ